MDPQVTLSFVCRHWVTTKWQPAIRVWRAPLPQGLWAQWEWEGSQDSLGRENQSLWNEWSDQWARSPEKGVAMLDWSKETSWRRVPAGTPGLPANGEGWEEHSQLGHGLKMSSLLPHWIGGGWGSGPQRDSWEMRQKCRAGTDVRNALKVVVWT